MSQKVKFCVMLLLSDFYIPPTVCRRFYKPQRCGTLTIDVGSNICGIETKYSFGLCKNVMDQRDQNR